MNIEGLLPIAIAGGVGLFLGAAVVGTIVRRRVMISGSKVIASSKNQFVGLASHYLLTPITIIQTAIARLEEGDSTMKAEERQKLYRAIGLGQQRLWIIAEQLILANEIDQNHLELKPSVVDVHELMISGMKAVDGFARAKNIEIRFQSTIAATAVQTRLDNRRMRQAIIALVDNAVKFSQEGGVVSVVISYENQEYTVSVKDQGIGMDTEILRHLGEEFYRANDIYNFNYEGIGLGLHSATAIIRMHGGMIAFESDKGRGTEVCFTIPSN
jgi:signal transduction histidine kinase